MDLAGADDGSSSGQPVCCWAFQSRCDYKTMQALISNKHQHQTGRAGWWSNSEKDHGSLPVSLSRGGTQLDKADVSAWDAINQTCSQLGTGAQQPVCSMHSGWSAASISSYSHVLEDFWGGEADVVSQHGLHVVLPRTKDLDLPNVGVSPVLMVADDCQLHKVSLQVFPADRNRCGARLQL